jgi:hypothetical protein
MLLSRIIVSVFEFAFGPIAIRVPSGFDPMSAPHIPNVVQPVRVLIVLAGIIGICGAVTLSTLAVAQVVGQNIPAIDYNWGIIMPWGR